MINVMHILYSGLGGHASVVFSLVEGDPKCQLKQSAVFYGNVKTVPFYKERCKSLSISYQSINKLRGIHFIANRKLSKILASSKPDVVILHTPQLINVLVKHKVAYPNLKIIAVEHHPNILKTRRKWKLSHQIMKLADSVVYLTEHYKDEVAKKMGSAFNENKSIVIGNGVNTNTYKPDLTKRRASVKERINFLNKLTVLKPNNPTVENSNFIIGMCTRLSDQKDIDTLLRSIHILVSKHTDIQPLLFLAGDGPHRRALEQLTTDLGIERNVVFLGMLDEHHLVDFYNSLDLYVHATFAETMSTSVMQALSTGLPVIASDISGMNTLINPKLKTGLLVPPGDEIALSQKIITVASDDELQLLLSNNAREKACKELSHIVACERYRSLMI